MVNVLMGAIIISIVLVIITNVFYKKEYLSTNFLSKNHTNIIKGIAIFIIVIAHIGNFSGTRYFTFLGGIGVTMFLICSGFGLYKSYESNGLEGFFKKRLSKVLIPYWIAVIVFYIINPIEFNITNFIGNISLIQVSAYYWFIQLIVVLYVMFYLVYRFIPENKRIICIGITSIMFFLLVKQNLWSEQSFSFIIGIYLAKYDRNDIKISKAWIIGVVSSFVSVISLLIKQTPLIRNSDYIIFNTNQAILCIGMAVGIIHLTYPLLKYSLIKIFSVSGLVSYEIYLVHTLFIFIVANKFTKSNIIIYIIVCSFVVYLFYFTNKRLIKPKKKS